MQINFLYLMPGFFIRFIGVPGLTPRRKAALSVLVPGFAGLYETDPDSRGKLKPGPGERLITELKEYGMAYHNCWHELM